jgi:hypothetical protein
MAVKAKNNKPEVPAGLSNKIQKFSHGLNLNFSLNQIDKRTKLGQAQKLLQDYLRAYIGECTIVSELLLSRIIYKAIKCYYYENTDIEKQALDESAGKLYLAYTNSLRCDLAELRKMADAPKEKTLMDYLKENYEPKHNSDITR